MKKLIVFMLLSVLAFTVGAQSSEQPAGLYTDRISYEIIGPNGAVVDSTVYDRNIGIPYTEALLLKYVRLTRCMNSETSVAVDATLSTGEFTDFLRDKLQEK